jgi:hypothetical protein
MEPRIKKSYRLSSAVVKALEALQSKGYAFPASTETGVVERAVREAWEKEFPGKSFPQDGGESEIRNEQRSV